MCCECDDRQIVQGRVFPDPPENFGAIHLGKRNVEDHDIRLVLSESLNCFHSAGELHDFILVLQDGSDDQPIVSIVVHHSNFVHSSPMISRQKLKEVHHA